VFYKLRKQIGKGGGIRKKDTVFLPDSKIKLEKKERKYV